MDDQSRWRQSTGCLSLRRRHRRANLWLKNSVSSGNMGGGSGSIDIFKDKYLYVRDNSAAIYPLSNVISYRSQRNVLVIDVSNYTNANVKTTSDYYAYGQYAIIGEDGTLVAGGNNASSTSGKNHDVSQGVLLILGLYTSGSAPTFTVTLS